MAERRSTTSTPPTHPRGSFDFLDRNVFSDQYAFDPLELTDSQETRSEDRDGSDDVASLPPVLETPRRSLSFQRAFESPRGSILRRGGSQRSDGLSSISLRSDEHGSHTFGPPRSVASVSDTGSSSLTPHRSIRSVSTFGFPRAQSPYQGATGPSHPYGMYPQGIGVTRTPSVATTSTIRQAERSYSGPNGPTQPYAMYTQNIVPEDDHHAVTDTPLPIAAGFPGLGLEYQRRLGPEGEDVDDLIGPDGYAEQLPPYSRYANGVPPKYTSGTGNVTRSAPPIPPDDSQETLNNSEDRREDSAALNPFDDSATELNSATGTTVLSKHESGSFKERVREKSRGKVCCGILPCWLLGVIILIVVFAVFIGGIIGGVLAHKRGEEKGRQEASQTTTVAVTGAAAPTVTINTSNAPDAEPLSSTPSNLPTLPTGSFSVPLSDPSTSFNACLTDSSQSDAWDCATGAELNIEVTISNGPPMVSLNYPAVPGARVQYGAQPPELDHQSPLVLMEYRDDPTKGPAYIFGQHYNKTVILKEEDLPGGYLPPKRSLFERWSLNEEVTDKPSRLHERDDSTWGSDSFVQPSDKPWYCFWNGTILEGFIFITQPANYSASESTTSSYPAATSESYPATTSESYPATTSESYSATTSESYPATTSESYPAATSEAYPRYGPPPKRQAPPSLLQYPKMIKIAERRPQYNCVQPYCQQMQILNTGQPGPLRSPTTNELIIVNLTESEPPFQHQDQEVSGDEGGRPGPWDSAGGQPRRRSHTKRQYHNSCQCEWTSGA